MQVVKVYLSIVLANLLISALVCEFWMSIAVCGLSAMAIVFARRLMSSQRRVVYLFIILNQLTMIYCNYLADRPQIVTFDPDHLVWNSTIPHSDGFVSIVLVPETGNVTTQEFEKLIINLMEQSSPILAKEIVVPDLPSLNLSSSSIPIVPSISPKTEFIIFLAPYITVPPNWLDGIVREHLANPKHLIIPTLITENNQVMGGMIGSVSGRWDLLPFDPRDRIVPIIPFFSAVGVSRGHLSIDRVRRLLVENRLLELSLYAWFCGEGISGTPFSSLTFAHVLKPHDWRSIEGETVDEHVASYCGIKNDMEWFYSKFSDYDPDASEQIRLIKALHGDQCMQVNLGNGLTVTECGRGNPLQIFRVYDNSSLIRSLGANSLCFDSGGASEPGKELILYHCDRYSRNQQFLVINEYIRWGSFCVNMHERRITLEICDRSTAQKFSFQPF